MSITTRGWGYGTPGTMGWGTYLFVAPAIGDHVWPGLSGLEDDTSNSALATVGELSELDESVNTSTMVDSGSTVIDIKSGHDSSLLDAGGDSGLDNVSTESNQKSSGSGSTMGPSGAESEL